MTHAALGGLLLGLALGDTVGLVVGVALDGTTVEVVPAGGAANFTLAPIPH